MALGAPGINGKGIRSARINHIAKESKSLTRQRLSRQF
jgi:hypothetical protein